MQDIAECWLCIMDPTIAVLIYFFCSNGVVSSLFMIIISIPVRRSYTFNYEHTSGNY